jgi:hypothetical protein
MQTAMRKRAQVNTTVRSAKATKMSQSIFFSPTANIVASSTYEPISAEVKRFPFGLPSDIWIG